MSQPDYSTHDPRGWCGDPKRGAALGRPTVQNAQQKISIRLYLRLVDIDDGGYDERGCYFGIGAPLYWVADADGEIDFVLRVYTREEAKKTVRAEYPNATFYR